MFEAITIRFDELESYKRSIKLEWVTQQGFYLSCPETGGGFMLKHEDYYYWLGLIEYTLWEANRKSLTRRFPNPELLEFIEEGQDIIDDKESKQYLADMFEIPEMSRLLNERKEKRHEDYLRIGL